jgi:uncharacterized protein YfaS (alpha-2-macroglobulin family)
MNFRKLVPYTALFCLSVASMFLVYCDQRPSETHQETKAMFEKEWNLVREYQDKGLTDSARGIVDTIYESAKKSGNSEIIVKSLLYRMMFDAYKEEDAFVKSLTRLKEEVVSAPFPSSAIIHSIIAHTYWNYFQNNRWKFMNRTQTVNFVNDDIRTWSLQKLASEITRHYELSLAEPEKLKKIKLSEFREIIEHQSNSGLRSTLFDLLVHRAIDAFKNDQTDIINPSYQFQLDDVNFFDRCDNFSKIKITSKDSLSRKYHAILLLQECIAFHLKDTDPEELIDVDLERLSFVRNNAAFESKDQLYLKALTELEKKYDGNKASAQVSAAIASWYMEKARTYNARTEQDYRWHYKKAMEICDATIKKFPDSYGARSCEAFRSEMTAKAAAITVEDVYVPRKPSKAFISYRNLDKVYFRIVKIDPDKITKIRNNHNSEEFISLIVKETPVEQWNLKLPNSGDYHNHTTEFKIPALPEGFYLIMCSADNDFSYNNNQISVSDIWISSISFIARTDNSNKKEFYTLDRSTGHPLVNVTAECWESRYNKLKREYEYVKTGTFASDKNGKVVIDRKGNSEYFNIKFFNGADKLYSGDGYQAYRYANPPSQSTTSNIFTDRAIYRPGQTIYYKGIVFQGDGTNAKVLSKNAVRVTFYDVNGQVVATNPHTTNEYGSYNGSFTAPSGVLNGQMQINDGYGQVSFSVEEYKRPKFEVTMKPLDGTYRLGDSITVKGDAKSYAGSVIDGAKVKYRIVRNATFPYWWYRWWSPYRSSGSVEIKNGETVTGADGSWSIDFKAIDDPTIDKSSMPVYTYAVTVDITDINGETRSTAGSVSIGYATLALQCAVPDMVDKNSQHSYPVSSTNLSGTFQPVSGTVEIYKLKSPSVPLRKRYWEQPDTSVMTKEVFSTLFPDDEFSNESDVRSWKREKKVLSIPFNTKESKELTLDKFRDLESGWYVLEAKCKDPFNNDVSFVKNFELFSVNDKQPPIATTDWFAPVKDQAEPGEKASFLIGTSLKDVRVLYEIEHRDVIVAKEWLTLSNEQKYIEIPVTEKHRGNFSVHVTFIKNNRVYKHQGTVTVPWTNKELSITFETFRNKLAPGQAEEWKLKIEGPKKDKIAAEMVAALYDASLDNFRMHQWGLSIYRSWYAQCAWETDALFGTKDAYYYGENWNTVISGPYRYYPSLQWFGYEPGYFYGYYAGYGGQGEVYPSAMAASEAPSPKDHKFLNKIAKLSKSKADISAPRAAAPKMAMDAMKEESVNQPPPPPAPEAPAEEKKADLSKVAARTNLNETAFFLPNLETDSAGAIIVKFTIPEALTRWKMLGLAHTKAMEIGTIQNSLVTQKDIMVMPNNPRFFRENDTIVYTAKVSNLTEHELNGKAQLFLTDPSTGKSLDIQFGNTTSQIVFKALKGQSCSLQWKITVPEGISAVSVKVVAQAGSFTDGEEIVIPILTNRVLVTETMPLPVRRQGETKFTLDKLVSMSKGSTTLRNHKLTLEFTPNPAWYAVQALPYLMEYPYECAEQTFARLYANSIASHIANSSPKIKSVFESWKNQTPDALLSNLEKNQELKSVLLEETPWVLEANNESARKQRVGLLFDLNRMSSEQGKALTKLLKMQMSNGGWPWFDGMPDNPYITQHIVCGLAKLDHINVLKLRSDNKLWPAVKNAVEYTDNRIRETYEYLIKHKLLNGDNLSYTEIQYLYMRSFYTDIPINDRNDEAVQYYKQAAVKYWLDKSRYMQGMIALALNRWKDTKTPVAIMKSLKQNALTNEEMGMYWKEQYEGFYWWEAPIEMQACMIEAFDEVVNDSNAVNDLKTWLLKSKQTQNWNTTRATTEAVYALLLRGADWLSTTSDATIKLGDMTIDPTKTDGKQPEAGTGYFKMSWSGSDIKPSMGNVTVIKQKNTVSWGGLYWQYFEQLDKITPHATPLKLDKKLFIERNTDRGSVLDPVTASNTLKVGDKLKVRIELRVDRDMEYVHMKDMRASGFEPVNVLSGYKWQDNLGYYESTRDAATHFFFEYLRKGTYVFEYPLVVSHSGYFSNGITTIQCMYAPEFASHSEGIRVDVAK